MKRQRLIVVRAYVPNTIVLKSLQLINKLKRGLPQILKFYSLFSVLVRLRRLAKEDFVILLRKDE